MSQAFLIKSWIVQEGVNIKEKHIVLSAWLKLAYRYVELLSPGSGYLENMIFFFFLHGIFTGSDLLSLDA